MATLNMSDPFTSSDVSCNQDQVKTTPINSKPTSVGATNVTTPTTNGATPPQMEIREYSPDMPDPVGLGTGGGSNSPGAVEEHTVPSTLTTPTTPPPHPPVVQEPFRPVPMVINLEKLLNKAPPTTVDPTSSSLAGRPVIPIDVRTPNMLKMVLLQASGPDSAAGEMRPMDLISLSGVCLRNERGTWRMVAGSNFHDPPPTTSSDHTETFPLMGGVRAVFNHTQKCWYVLPPLTVTMGEPPLEQRGLTDSQKMGSVERPDSTPKPPDLFLSKKAIVTAVGGAINSVLAQFEQTRSVEEKKRIGSDMSNPNMGHLVRGSICTALARLLLDGLKPYRFQGLVSDDIWKVTSSFWQEGKASSSPDCPHVLTTSITVHSCYQGSVVAISGQAGISSSPISGR